MDAKWYRLATLRLGDRLDERRHVGRALPARPRALPRAAQEDDRDPRSSCAASGRGWPRSTAPRSARSPRPRRGTQTFRPWTEGGPDRSMTDPAAGAAGSPSGATAHTCRCGPPAANGGLVGGLPPALPAAAAGATQHQGALPGLGARAGVVLHQPDGAVPDVLLHLRDHPRPRRQIENFAIHLFAGMVLVHFFTETFSAGTRSIVQNRAWCRRSRCPGRSSRSRWMLVSL